MIDLNYKSPQSSVHSTQKWEPEEIVLAVITGILWAFIAFQIGAAL